LSDQVEVVRRLSAAVGDRDLERSQMVHVDPYAVVRFLRNVGHTRDDEPVRLS
jgi:hypothetical protein